MGVYEKNGNWYIRYYIGDKNVRRKVGPTKGLAEIALKKIKVAMAEGKYLDIKREQKIKFEEFADEYIKTHSKTNNKSWEQTDLHTVKCLKAFFAGKYLSEITPQMVEQFKAKRVTEVKPATTNRALALLKSIFNKATAWNKFDGRNPVKGIKFYKEHPRLRFLEREDITKLIDNNTEPLKSIVIIALNTGMRRGEIFNLKWHDIDFERGIISLYQTKNGEQRKVPMNEQVKQTIIAVRKTPDSPYIFCNKDKRPYCDIRKSFFTACDKCGITDFHFHDLRHTFASQLVMSGIDLNTVRELLGHKTIEMTLRYAHLSPDFKKRAVDILGRKIGILPMPVQKEAEKTEVFKIATTAFIQE
ncbi:MAG: tyrosine-type recombinase/integrase [Candidatus Omnitrophica bacterium]|nr:tyrosine-type recombinase/integrase [Candidatus Omnitrophota bacterium]